MMISPFKRVSTIPLTNLVPNGGFETNTTGWVGWHAYVQGNTPRVETHPITIEDIKTPIHGETGVKAAQIGTGNQGSQGSFYINLGTVSGNTQNNVPIAVTPGNKYYIRAQVTLRGQTAGKESTLTACTIINDLIYQPDRVTLPEPISDGMQTFLVPTLEDPAVWALLDTIWTADTPSLYLRVVWQRLGNTGNSDIHGQIDNIVVVDLTKDFESYGPGNEPPIIAIRGGVLYNPPHGHWDGTMDITMPVPPEIITLSIPPALKGRSYAGPYGQPVQIEIRPETGTPPFIFAVDGLPQGHGLHIGPDGYFSGVVGLPENSYPFTVWVTDSIGYQVSHPYTLVVGEPPVILDEFLINPTVDEPYNFIPNVIGSNTPTPLSVRLEAVEGPMFLPDGLSIVTDPVTGFQMITGTPTDTGDACTIRITAQNEYDTVIKTFPMTVYLSPYINNTSPLPPATLNAPYEVEFIVSGKKPVLIEYLSDDTPPGLTFENGVLFGTPTQVGTYTFSVRATYTGDPPHPDPPHPNTHTKVFTLTVSEIPVITTTMFGYARLATPYSGRLTATGTEPIHYSIISGALPPGLSLNEETGVISGFALSTGSFTFTVAASNLAGDSQPRTFTIDSGSALAIVTTSPLPPGTLGVMYSSFRFEAAGLDYSYAEMQTPQPVETWFPVVDSSLGLVMPPGLELLSDGTFRGTPTQAGVFNFRVRIVNGPVGVTPPSPETTSPFTIEIGTPPTITTPASLMGGISRPFTVTLQATGPQPITFKFSESHPPPIANIQLDEEGTGALYWLIPEVGAYEFWIVAENVFGACPPVRFVLTITTPSIIDRQEDLNIGVVGDAYTYTFSAGGVGPFTWNLTGNLPNGLFFDANTATISGTPAMAGETPFHLKVTNAGGFAEEDFTLIVYERPYFRTTAARSGNVGTSYTQTILTGGTAPMALSLISGTLPDGLFLGAASITGSPTQTGTFTFTLQAVNGLGLPYAAAQAFTITVLPSNAPVITTDNNQRGIKGVPFTMTLEATPAAPATPIVFAVVDPITSPLPDGLALVYDSVNEIYTVEGTPTVPGVHTFTLSAANNDGTDYRSFTLFVGDPPVITSTLLPDGLTGAAYLAQLAATGDTPMHWEVLPPTGGETGLPPGLSLTPGMGVISGTPAVSGEFNFQIGVANATGIEDTKAFTIRITLSGGTFINGDEIACLFINGEEVSEVYVNGELIYKQG